MADAAFLIIKSKEGHGDEFCRILMSHRRDSSFGFPGGKIENGETPFNAMIRV